MTTVERFDDASGTWVAIEYGDWSIEHGVSDVQVAPTATLDTQRTSPITSGERLRITESGATLFVGDVSKTKPRTRGPMRVDAEHDAHRLFEERVSLSVSGTDADVLAAALPSGWTLDYAGTATNLGDTYDVEGRSIKRVFRDMADRVGRVWWVDVDHTVHFEPRGAQGLLASVNTSTDGAQVTESVPDNVETVVNDVTVYGTGGVAVVGTASDAGSISTYGRRPLSVNVEYITSQAEADAYASALLRPTPAAAATVDVAPSVAPVASPVVNADLDVTDPDGTGLDARLMVEQQTVRQGGAKLKLGEGTGVNVAQFNRQQKSDDDKTAPGAVMDSARLADGSVLEQKLSDLSVTLDKVAPDAIDETKVADEAITTPKLAAGAVIASKILANTITANEIAADTLTANEVDTLALTSGQLTIAADADQPLVAGIGNIINFESEAVFRPETGGYGQVGTSGNPFREMHSFNYITETPEAFGDRGVDLSALGGYSWRNPPEYAIQREAGDGSYTRRNPRDHGLDLGHMTNWLLEVTKAQQQRIDDLEARVAALEN